MSTAMYHLLLSLLEIYVNLCTIVYLTCRLNIDKLNKYCLLELGEMLDYNYVDLHSQYYINSK